MMTRTSRRPRYHTYHTSDVIGLQHYQVVLLKVLCGGMGHRVSCMQLSQILSHFFVLSTKYRYYMASAEHLSLRIAHLRILGTRNSEPTLLDAIGIPKFQYKNKSTTYSTAMNYERSRLLSAAPCGLTHKELPAVLVASL
jgi:hypothetical protein